MIDMTLNQLIERRRKLEKDISALLHDFHKETQLTPTIDQGPHKWETDYGHVYDDNDYLSVFIIIKL